MDKVIKFFKERPCWFFGHGLPKGGIDDGRKYVCSKCGKEFMYVRIENNRPYHPYSCTYKFVPYRDTTIERKRALERHMRFVDCIESVKDKKQVNKIVQSNI